MDKVYNFVSKYSLVISIIILAVFFFGFYPAKYINIDEHDYLNNAKLFIDGGLKRDCDLKILGQWSAGDYCISKYNIGTSLFLIPASLINDNLAFATTFLLFIFCIYIFSKLLSNFKIDKIFLYLFSFYPAYIYFTRTLLSEIYSMTFILLSFYLLTVFLKDKKIYVGILTGIAMGIAVYIRYTNVIPLAVLAGTVVLQNIYELRHELRKEFFSIVKKYLPILIGMLPLMILLFVFNSYNYGGIFRSGYYFAFEEGVIVLNQIPEIFIKYILLFDFIYPGMLIFSFFNKNKYKIPVYAAFMSVFIFYLFIRNLSFGGGVIDLIVGTRYLLPVLPLLLFLYSDSLNKFTNKKIFRFAALGFIAILFIGCIVINFYHYNFLINYTGTL